MVELRSGSAEGRIRRRPRSERPGYYAVFLTEHGRAPGAFSCLLR